MRYSFFPSSFFPLSVFQDRLCWKSLCRCFWERKIELWYYQIVWHQCQWLFEWFSSILVRFWALTFHLTYFYEYFHRNFHDHHTEISSPYGHRINDSIKWFFTHIWKVLYLHLWGIYISGSDTKRGWIKWRLPCFFFVFLTRNKTFHEKHFSVLK